MATATSTPSSDDHVPVLCIVGPTASGKSSLAQEVSSQIDGEVVSADSMQVYRGMDIGTGKVPIHERTVPHHGLDIVDPGEPFSAALFQDYARSCFVDIESRGKRPVLCGGTGFYVRAAIDDYRFPKGDQIGNETRDSWLAFAEEHGSQMLWNELRKADPASAEIIPAADVKRVIRAFELLEEGTSYATQKANLANLAQLWPATLVGLAVDAGVLRARIDARVDAMVEEGLVEEVENLIAAGFEQAITAPQAIGYKEIVAYLHGTVSFDEAIESIKTATHRYAKRQRTWFRKDKRISWLDATEFDLERLTAETISIAATMYPTAKELA